MGLSVGLRIKCTMRRREHAEEDNRENSVGLRTQCMIRYKEHRQEDGRDNSVWLSVETRTKCMMSR